jgi:hypothetical protein
MKIELKQENYYFYIHNVDECSDILLHCNILCSQLSFTTNMEKKPWAQPVDQDTVMISRHGHPQNEPQIAAKLQITPIRP